MEYFIMAINPEQQPNLAAGIPQSITNKARSDKFQMVLTLPKVMLNINSQILSKRTQDFIQQDALQFAVWGIVVPSVGVPSQETSMWGQPYRVTSQARKAYDPVALNFTIDNGFNNYWLLWKWLEFLNKPRQSGVKEEIADLAGEKNNAYHDYQTIITIYGLNEYNDRVVQFDYIGSFITDLGEIRYNYRDPSELESSFQFVFNQMKVTLLEEGIPANT